MKQCIYDIIWTICLYIVYFLQLYLITAWQQPAHSAPLHGYISNKELQKLKPKFDNRCPIQKGKVEFEHCRGYIGILFNPLTGRIDYIYPESKLKANIGDFILEINHEAYRPCLMPNVTFYPKDSFIDLTISHNGQIQHISVQLLDASKFVSQ